MENNEWKLIITKSSNGYILEGKFNNSDIVTKFVIEEEDTELGELEAMEKLLYEIKDYFGIYFSKHNKKNIVIKIIKNKEL